MTCKRHHAVVVAAGAAGVLVVELLFFLLLLQKLYRRQRLSLAPPAKHKKKYNRDLLVAIFALQELSRSDAVGSHGISLATNITDDVIETIVTATEKEITIMRRSLGNGTALKRLYVSLELASTFMPPLPPFRVHQGKSNERGEDQKTKKQEEKVVAPATMVLQ